jgi:hypothetical protein
MRYEGRDGQVLNFYSDIGWLEQRLCKKDGIRFAG